MTSVRRVSLLVASFGLVATVLLAAAIRLDHMRRAPVRPTAARAATVLPAAAPAQRPVRRHGASFLHPAEAVFSTSPAAADDAPAAAAPQEVSATPRARPTLVRAVPPVTLAAPAAPHSVEVFTVAVPHQLPTTDSVPWRVVPTGKTELLSAREGVLLPAASDSERHVVVVTRVPATAPAGPTHVATAEFDGPDATLTVSVNLVVSRIRRADLRLIRSALALRPADRAELSALLTNRGNATDTISLDAGLPQGWRLIGTAPVVVLRAGQQQIVRMAVSVPRDAQPEHTYAVVTARASGIALADATADIDVLGAMDRAGRGGPILTTAVASSVGDSTASAPVVAFELSGNYSQNTTLSGRAAFATDPRNANIQAVGRVGVYLGQAYLTASNPHWQATVGGTGRQFSTTAGLNAYGVGVSGSAAADRWSAGFMAAEPTGGASGQLLGAQFGYQLPVGLLSATTTDFQETGVYSRSLHAEGLDYTSNAILETHFTGGLAWRDFTGGSGLGWSLGANRSTPNDYLSFLASHTPGGSQAYSPATDQFIVSAMRRLSDRFTVHGGFARSADQSTTFSDLSSQSASLGTDVRLKEAQTVGLDLMANQFSATGTGLGFGSKDVTAKTTLRTQYRQYATELSVSAGQVQRSTTLGGLAVDGPAAARIGAAASVGWTSSRGHFMASGSYDYSGPGAGFYPRALQVGVAADGVVISNNPKVPTIQASILRYDWFGDRPGATVVRVGSAIQLGDDYRLMVDVERNPLLQTDPRRTTPVIAAIKIERSIGIPFSHRSADAQGVVYEDLNGNGMRDRGEPPLAGVMIRRGGEVTTTDEKGRFALYQSDSRTATIDATSLPLGLVPGTITAATHELVMGVMPTSAVDVTLTPVADELGRHPVVTDLTPAVIIARDSAGMVWTIQADSVGHARLDALPPGHYTISADFSGFEERLRVIGPSPAVEVRAGTPVPPVQLPFGLGAVKMYNNRNGVPVPLARERK